MCWLVASTNRPTTIKRLLEFLGELLPAPGRARSGRGPASWPWTMAIWVWQLVVERLRFWANRRSSSGLTTAWAIAVISLDVKPPDVAGIGSTPIPTYPRTGRRKAPNGWMSWPARPDRNGPTSPLASVGPTRPSPTNPRRSSHDIRPSPRASSRPAPATSSKRGSRELGRPATLDDLPDAWIDRIAGLRLRLRLDARRLDDRPGGPRGLTVAGRLAGGIPPRPARRDRRRHRRLAVRHQALRGPPGIRRRSCAGSVASPAQRARAAALILDFVPNHVALDHPFAVEHPEFLISGTQEQLDREPRNFVRLADSPIFAHGRDPYFSGWPDPSSSHHRRPALRDAMAAELVAMAARCDGLRCDMAMLVLPDVFTKTSGRLDAPWDVSDAFWTLAIRGVKEHHPGFVFMAEAYWGLEWTLQCQGFDYTYDKTNVRQAWSDATRPASAATCTPNRPIRLAPSASSRITTSRGPPPPSPYPSIARWPC